MSQCFVGRYRSTHMHKRSTHTTTETLTEKLCLWNKMPCSLAESYKHFGENYCLLHQGKQNTFVLSFYEIAAKFYTITRCLIPRQSNFPAHHRTQLSTRKKVLTRARYGTEKTHGNVIQIFSRLPNVGRSKWLLSLLHRRDLPISFDGTLTNYTNQTPSRESKNVSAIQEIPRILWNPKVHDSIPKSLPLAPLLSQTNPVHNPQPTSWISILILSFDLRLGLPSSLFPSGLPIKSLYALLMYPIRATCPAHLLLGFIECSFSM